MWMVLSSKLKGIKRAKSLLKVIFVIYIKKANKKGNFLLGEGPYTNCFAQLTSGRAIPFTERDEVLSLHLFNFLLFLFIYLFIL